MVEKLVDSINFKTTYVFDISQTEGKPVPHLINKLEGTKENFNSIMQCLQKVSPLPIQFEDIKNNSNGYCFKDKIVIKNNMSDVQTIKTCIHEIAHAKLQHLNSKEKDLFTKELEAESIAFIVCEHLGIDSSDFSFPYLATYSKDKELTQLKTSLETIQNQANNIICSIDKEYELLLGKNLEKDNNVDLHTNDISLIEKDNNIDLHTNNINLIEKDNNIDLHTNDISLIEKQINTKFEPTISVINTYRFKEIDDLYILNKPISVGEINTFIKNMDNKLSEADKEHPLLFKIDYMFQGENKSFEFKQYLGNNNGSILDNLYKISKFYTLNPFGRSELGFNPEKQKQYEFIYNFIVPYLAIHIDIHTLEDNIKKRIDNIKSHKETPFNSPFKTRYLKMHTEVLKYLDKCKGILNSGNLEIPYTTPELEKVEKQFINFCSNKNSDFYLPSPNFLPSKIVKPALTLTIKNYLPNYKNLEDKIEPVKDKIELEKDKVEPIQNKTELEKDKVEPIQNKTELEKDKIKPIQNKAELEKDKIKPIQNKTELEKDKVEPIQNKIEVDNIDKQSDFTPVIIVGNNKDNYVNSLFEKKRELTLNSTYNITLNADKNNSQNEEKHLIPFKIKYILNGKQKIFKFKQCLGDKSGDFLNSIYLNSAKDLDKDFVHNFFLQYIDTHRILEKIQEQLNLSINDLKINKGTMSKLRFDLNSELLKETSNYISTCRKILNSGVLEIPPITPEMDNLSKKIENTSNAIYTVIFNSSPQWQCNIVDIIREELNNIRFKKEIEPSIYTDKQNNKKSSLSEKIKTSKEIAKSISNEKSSLNEKFKTSKEIAKSISNEKSSLSEKIKTSKEIAKNINNEKPSSAINNSNKSKENER